MRDRDIHDLPDALVDDLPEEFWLARLQPERQRVTRADLVKLGKDIARSLWPRPVMWFRAFVFSSAALIFYVLAAYWGQFKWLALYFAFTAANNILADTVVKSMNRIFYSGAELLRINVGETTAEKELRRANG
jgi:hypothetical protein